MNLQFVFNLMACGKKSNNAPTEEFILESPAPVDVAAKISAIYRELSEKVIRYTSLILFTIVFRFVLIYFKLFMNVLFCLQEKERTYDLLQAAKFSESICNDLVSISTSVESPGK